MSALEHPDRTLQRAAPVSKAAARPILLAVGLLAMLRAEAACSSDVDPAPAPGTGPSGPTEVVEAGAPPTPSTVPLRGDVLTSKNDNGRTGWNHDEVGLDVTNVGGLVELGSYAVDGDLTTQPLVASGVPTSGGERNLVFVATMNNSVYAFDADARGADAAPVWKRGQEVFGPAPSTYNWLSQHGILSTPVIDRERGVIDVVSRSCSPETPASAPACEYHLVALALGTGDVVRRATIAGSGAAGAVTFDPAAQWNRPGLLLQSGRLVLAFGAGPRMTQHEEDFIYHGWLFSYDAANFDAPPLVYCSTPQSRGGGIWQAGTGVAADEQAVYFATGNRVLANQVEPPDHYPTTPLDHEDSVIRLPLTDPTYVPGQPGPLAYWDHRPYREAGNVFQFMESNDIDFGASAPMLLPDTNRIVAGSKSGMVYLLDRATMQEVQTPLSPFTNLGLASGETLYVYSWATVPMIIGSMVHFRPDGDKDRVYAWPAGDYLKSLVYDRAADQLELAQTASVPALGGMLSVSSNGGAASSAIVWASTGSEAGVTPGHLWAFDAMSLATLVDIETPGSGKFSPPTVARGRVFLATATRQVLVYGLP